MQRDGLDGDPVVWATNRGSGPIALAWRGGEQRGRLRQGVSLPRADGARQRVLGIALSCRGASREHNGRPGSTALLLLFSDRFEAYSACVSPRTGASATSSGLGGRLGTFGRGELSGGTALCITSCEALVYVGDGGRHAVLVYECAPACSSARYLRQIGGSGATAVWRSASQSVGRAGAGERAAEPLLRVADWDRVYVLTLQGAPLQVIPVAGSSTRRVNGICLDADGEHLWLVSAERHSLCRFEYLNRSAYSRAQRN